MRRVALLVSMMVAGAPLVHAPLVRADAPDVATLEASAEAAFQAGDYREALRGFERLYRLRPQPETLFAIARCHEEYPPLQTVTPDHAAACWRAAETADMP